MPLPNLNPLDKAPPPGSQRQVATSANIAQLHQRITELERRLNESASKGSSWTPITGHTYISPWGAWAGAGAAAYVPSYRIEGDTVYLSGLIVPSSGTAAGANIMTLPDFLRPAPAVIGQSGAGAHFFSCGIQAGTGADVYIMPYDNPTTPGRMVCVPAYPAGNYIGLSNIHYRRRPDM